MSSSTSGKHKRRSCCLFFTRKPEVVQEHSTTVVTQKVQHTRTTSSYATTRKLKVSHGFLSHTRSTSQSSSVGNPSFQETDETSQYTMSDDDEYLDREPGRVFPRSYYPPRTSSLPSAHTSLLPSREPRSANTKSHTKNAAGTGAHMPGSTLNGVSPLTVSSDISENIKSTVSPWGWTSPAVPARSTSPVHPAEKIEESTSRIDNAQLGNHAMESEMVSPTISSSADHRNEKTSSSLSSHEELPKSSDISGNLNQTVSSFGHTSLPVPDRSSSLVHQVLEVKKRVVRKENVKTLEITMDSEMNRSSDSTPVEIKYHRKPWHSANDLKVAKPRSEKIVAEASSVALEKNHTRDRPTRNVSFVGIDQIIQNTSDDAAIQTEQTSKEASQIPSGREVNLEGRQHNGSRLSTPSTERFWPDFHQVQIWSPLGSAIPGGVPRETPLQLSSNAPTAATKKLTAIYVCHQSPKDLIHVYRNWPLSKPLPAQFINLWGDKIVDGKRVEQPNFVLPKELILLDLYEFESPSGYKTYGWVDFRVLAKYLIPRAKFSEVHEMQASQFNHVKTLIFDDSCLDTIVRRCRNRNANFLFQFLRLQEFVINTEGKKHFGPSPGYEDMMGFKQLTRNTARALAIHKKAMRLLAAVSEEHPRWLPPQLIPVERAVSQAVSYSLGNAFRFENQDIRDFNDLSKRFSAPNLENSLRMSGGVVSVGDLPASRKIVEARNVSFSALEDVHRSADDGHSHAGAEFRRSATEPLVHPRNVDSKDTRLSEQHEPSVQELELPRQPASSPGVKGRFKGFIRAVSEPKMLLRSQGWRDTVASARYQRSVARARAGNYDSSDDESSFRPAQRLSNAFGIATRLHRSATFTSLRNHVSPTGQSGTQHREPGLKIPGNRLSSALNALPEKLRSAFASSSFKAYSEDNKVIWNRARK